MERTEIGIINVGEKGIVEADSMKYELEFKEVLYISKETKKVNLSSSDNSNPGRFYINSAPAHLKFSTKKMNKKEAESVTLGTFENSNPRVITKLIVNIILETCQVQMGMTELKIGSVWNTMPAHSHSRRTEVYFHCEILAGKLVSHFMGQPQETRHNWMQNEKAVISPYWSIHAGAGTSDYTFIRGMAGENLDYADMVVAAVKDFR